MREISHKVRTPALLVVPLFFYSNLFLFRTLVFSSFWTSRGHRCCPFFPPVLAFHFCREEGSAIPLVVHFSSSVANSRSRIFRDSICAQEKKSRRIYCSMHSAGLELTKHTYTRLEDILIHHRDDRFVPRRMRLNPYSARPTPHCVLSRHVKSAGVIGFGGLQLCIKRVHRHPPVVT